MEFYYLDELIAILMLERKINKSQILSMSIRGNKHALIFFFAWRRKWGLRVKKRKKGGHDLCLPGTLPKDSVPTNLDRGHMPPCWCGRARHQMLLTSFYFASTPKNLMPSKGFIWSNRGSKYKGGFLKKAKKKKEFHSKNLAWKQRHWIWSILNPRPILSCPYLQ